MKRIDTIIVDMDGVAFNTIKAIVQMYDNEYHDFPYYKKVHWTEINTWDFTELNCSDLNHINEYFNSPQFFEIVEPMDNFNEIVVRLKDKYHIIFCSMGESKNLALKREYVHRNYPFADFVGVDISQYADKSHIDMQNAILIDDSSRNLQKSNAVLKILFGDDYPWNQGWRGLRCYNWYDVERSLKRWID